MTFRRLLRSCLLIAFAVDAQTRCVLREAVCHTSDPGCNSLSLIILYRSGLSSSNLVPRALYVSDLTPAGAIFQYSIDEGKNLTPMSPVSVASGNSGGFLALAPDRRFLYTDDIGPTVFRFATDPTTGALSAAGSFTTANNSNPLIVRPDLRFGYASNNGGTNIDIFTYDASTGAVTPNGSATNISGVNSQSSLVEPSGRFYYTSNQGNNTISQFAIDQANGSLTSIGAAVGSGGTLAAGICTDPNGRWLYVQNVGTGGLRSFQIDQITGALSLVGVSALPADITCAVTANGRFLVNQAGGGINVFRIDQTTGALSFDANYAATECPGGGAVAVDLQGGVYCATNTQVAAFRMDETTGALTLTNTAPISIVGNVAQSAVFHVPRL